jgi:hypothetical protein
MHREKNTMDRGFGMPYVEGVKIPWVRSRYARDRGFDIP